MSSVTTHVEIRDNLQKSFIETPLSNMINWSSMIEEEFHNYYFNGQINEVYQARPFITDPPFKEWIDYNPIIFPWLGTDFSHSLIKDRTFFVEWTLRPHTAELERGNPDSIVSVYDETTHQIVKNIIYNNGGVCILLVDFTRHGEASSGHWHILNPGKLDYNEDEAYDWTLCPWVFQAIPTAFNMQPAGRIGSAPKRL